MGLIVVHTKDARHQTEVILPPDCECELGQLQVDDKGIQSASNANEHMKNGKWFSR